MPIFELRIKTCRMRISQEGYMKIFAISDIHGALRPIEAASGLLEDSDFVVISGDITRNGTKGEAKEILGLIEQCNPNIIAVHGNWDKSEVGDHLEERGYSIHAQGRIIDGVGFFGVGGSNPTPINTASEYSEEEIRRFILKGYPAVKDSRVKVMVSHAPPRGARDRMFLGLRVGSISVNEFLNQNHIDLCICGHIHEGRGHEEMNHTIVVNPGSFKRGCYAIINISDNIQIEQGKLRKIN
jgi:Icc-related predicted phosphoesterase